MKRLTLYWIIAIGCILIAHLWRLNSIYSLIDWIVNIYFPKLNTTSIWNSLVLSTTFILAGIGFLMFRIAARELSKVKSIWKRRYKVVKVLTNFGIFPYVVFQVIYTPLREFGVNVSNTLKIILILTQVCLILLAIYLSIGKDNEIYLKE